MPIWAYVRMRVCVYTHMHIQACLELPRSAWPGSSCCPELPQSAGLLPPQPAAKFCLQKAKKVRTPWRGSMLHTLPRSQLALRFSAVERLAMTE